MVRISQAARARAAQVEAIEAAAEKVRSKRRARALAEAYARGEDLEALASSLERELAAVRERYAVKADAITAARDGALLELADLGRAPAAIGESVGLSTREVVRALSAARRARGDGTTADADTVDANDAADATNATATASATTAGTAHTAGAGAGRVVDLAHHRPEHATATADAAGAGPKGPAQVLAIAVGQSPPLPAARAVRADLALAPAAHDGTTGDGSDAVQGGGGAVLF